MSARRAAKILREKGTGYERGGKEASKIHDDAWDSAEPRMAFLHVKHAREFLSKIPASKKKSLASQIDRMNRSITNVENEASKGAKNAEKTRKAQFDLFDAQSKIESIIRKNKE